MADPLAAGQGQTAAEIAESTGYSRYWIGQIAKRYNAEGPQGCATGSTRTRTGPRRCSRAEQLAELAAAVRGPAPEGDDGWGARSPTG